MVKPLRTSRKVASATVRDTVDAFLSSPRCANPNTRRAYTGVLDRVLDEIGAEVELGQVSGEQLAEVLERLWGERSPATWNRNRAAVAAWLSWCARAGRARLGYDRARVLFTAHTGWELHQLRHSAATFLGEQGIPLQLIMARPGTRTHAPRCATSNPAPRP